jgi:hypothetical protein
MQRWFDPKSGYVSAAPVPQTYRALCLVTPTGCRDRVIVTCSEPRAVGGCVHLACTLLHAIWVPISVHLHFTPLPASEVGLRTSTATNVSNEYYSNITECMSVCRINCTNILSPGLPSPLVTLSGGVSVFAARIRLFCFTHLHLRLQNQYLHHHHGHVHI